MKKIFTNFFAFLFSTAAFAQDGTLDPSYGNNGVATLSTNQILGIDRAMQSDGKLLTLQPTRSGSLSGFSLIRFNNNGTLDAGFGSGGTTSVVIPEITTSRTHQIAFQNNGDIVVQVSAYGPVPSQQPGSPAMYYAVIALVRFQSNGVLDASFGSNGLVVEHYQGEGDITPSAAALAVQSDGGIIQALNVRVINGTLARVNLIRFNSNGTRDHSFSSSPILNQYQVTSAELAIGPNDEIILAGSSQAPRVFDLPRFMLARFTSNGTLVFLVTNGPGNITHPMRAASPVVQSDGKIVVSKVGELDPKLLRFLPDGTLDHTFGSSEGVSSIIYVTKILIQQNGKFIVYGFRPISSTQVQYLISRYNGDGSLDVAFGQNGIASIPQGIGSIGAIVGNRLYAYGNDAIAAFRLSSSTTTCTPPTFLNNHQIVLNATCEGNNGNVYIIPQSGTAPFLYSIDGGTTYVSSPYPTGATFENLAAGTYHLRLKDANGCESGIVSREVTSTRPSFLNNHQIVLNASCAGNDGNISIIPTCGKAPFLYSINGGTTYVSSPYPTGATFLNLSAGTYRLRMKDSNGIESEVVERRVENGCTTATAARRGESAAGELLSTQKASTSVYPTLTKGAFTVRLENLSAQRAEVTIFDAKGVLMEKRSLLLTKGGTAHFDLSRRAKGLYYVQIRSNSEVKVTKVIVQ